MAVEKQLAFFNDQRNDSETKYTVIAGSPVYVPTGRNPHVLILRDVNRRNMLMRHIRDAAEEGAITKEQADFLNDAAHRHTVFNYELIAEYYAHADPQMQRLMEESALVIIDVNKAIELGYVQLCHTIRTAYLESAEEIDEEELAAIEAADNA